MRSRRFAFLCAAAMTACGASLALAQSPPVPNRLAVEAGAQVFPFYWCVGGPLGHTVNWGDLPIRNDGAVMFYEMTFGLYPRIWEARDGSRTSFENGGVPQSADMPRHLAKVRTDIARLIPDRSWRGYAVIDFEAWFPSWETLPEVMREESRRLVRQRYGLLPAAEIERRAIRDFESAAEDFLLRTIEVCKQERPNALWGFYGHPYPEWDQYRPKYQRVFDAVDAFYPPIYALHYSVADHAAPRPGQNRIREYGRRIDQRISLTRTIAGNRPVLALIWMRYHDMNPTYGMTMVNDLDLAMMVRRPRTTGANGAIFWDAVDSPSLVNQYNQEFASRVGSLMRQFLAELAPSMPSAAATANSGGQLTASRNGPTTSSKSRTYTNPNSANSSGGSGASGGAAPPPSSPTPAPRVLTRTNSSTTTKQ